MASRTAGRLLTAYDLMDGMRAPAAMTVLISHERNILFLDATAALSAPWKFFYFVTGFGHQAVMIFFVLSGYWITKTVTRRSAKGGFAWSDYAIGRLSRLWIVLIPCCSAVFSTALGGTELQHRYTWAYRERVRSLGM
jgi:peptidoglycan/LPS O-acetylase OafA/YrhL